MRIYVDGQSRPLDTPIDKLSSNIVAEAPLLIGTRSKAYPFAGLIDEVRFHSRALKADEAVALATHGQLLATATPAVNHKAASLQDAVSLEAARPVREQDPVRTYRQLSHLLSRP